MKTIALCQLKGGSGRSTIATNLSSILSQEASVLLLDCDTPQYSAKAWFSARKGGEPQKGRLDCITVDSVENLQSILTKASESGVDYVVIDGAPRIAKILRASLLFADLALIPIGSSVNDVWATQDLKPILEEAKKIRPSLQIRAVWNRVKPSTKIAGYLSEALPSVFPFPVLKSRFSDRVAFMEAFFFGVSAVELASAPPAAKREARSLATEVKSILEEGNQ